MMTEGRQLVDICCHSWDRIRGMCMCMHSQRVTRHRRAWVQLGITTGFRELLNREGHEFTRADYGNDSSASAAGGRISETNCRLLGDESLPNGNSDEECENPGAAIRPQSRQSPETALSRTQPHPAADRQASHGTSPARKQRIARTPAALW